MRKALVLLLLATVVAERREAPWVRRERRLERLLDGAEAQEGLELVEEELERQQAPLHDLERQQAPLQDPSLNLDAMEDGLYALLEHMQQEKPVSLPAIETNINQMQMNIQRLRSQSLSGIDRSKLKKALVLREQALEQLVHEVEVGDVQPHPLLWKTLEQQQLEAEKAHQEEEEANKKAAEKAAAEQREAAEREAKERDGWALRQWPMGTLNNDQSDKPQLTLPPTPVPTPTPTQASTPVPEPTKEPTPTPQKGVKLPPSEGDGWALRMWPMGTLPNDNQKGGWGVD